MAVFSLAVAADQNLEQLFLPKGYRFAPRDHELLIHYLANKILNHRLPANIIPTLHLYQYEPHQLPIDNFKYGRPNEAYFFSELEETQPNDLAIRTQNGYWKATGKATNILHDGLIVGTKRTLIFHWGQSLIGKKSPWMVKEFRIDPILIPAAAMNNNIRKKVQSYVLCRIQRNVQTTKMNTTVKMLEEGN